MQRLKILNSCRGEKKKEKKKERGTENMWIRLVIYTLKEE